MTPTTTPTAIPTFDEPPPPLLCCEVEAGLAVGVAITVVPALTVTTDGFADVVDDGVDAEDELELLPLLTTIRGTDSREIDLIVTNATAHLGVEALDRVCRQWSLLTLSDAGGKSDPQRQFEPPVVAITGIPKPAHMG